jgi:hypothetical protein
MGRFRKLSYTKRYVLLWLAVCMIEGLFIYTQSVILASYSVCFFAALSFAIAFYRFMHCRHKIALFLQQADPILFQKYCYKGVGFLCLAKYALLDKKLLAALDGSSRKNEKEMEAIFGPYIFLSLFSFGLFAFSIAWKHV